MKNIIGVKKLFWFWNKLYKLALIGMNYGADPDLYKSGEVVVLKYIKKNISKENLVIFDVGANIGLYTNVLIDFFYPNEITIHSFEPLKETFLNLRNNVNYKNAVLNQFGLGNNIEEETLFCYEDHSAMNSLYNRNLDFKKISPSKTEKIKIDTIDNYCQTNKIKEIDFLKIDVEGNELNVLKGSKNMIENDAIKTIQFEFGGASIDSKTFFKDFWALLSDKYRLYWILQDDIKEIEKYNENLEIFVYSNFFAVLK